MRVAILSDTHGLLRPELLSHLEDVEHILHAGDVGEPEILMALEAVAPVSAVWGNTDGFALRSRIPEVQHPTLAGYRVIVVHGHRLGTPTPEALAAQYPKADLIVFGHTHRPLIRRVGSVQAVNPGSCGPRRFDLAPTIVLADLEPDRIGTTLVELP